MFCLVIGGVHVGNQPDGGCIRLIARQAGGEVAVLIQGDLGQPKLGHLIEEGAGEDELALAAGTDRIGRIGAGMKSQITQKTLKQGIHWQASNHKRGTIVAKTAGPLIASAQFLMNLSGQGSRCTGWREGLLLEV
ncbi:hypothetical protein D3C77_528780 [compost metagenome]